MALLIGQLVLSSGDEVAEPSQRRQSRFGVVTSAGFEVVTASDLTQGGRILAPHGALLLESSAQHAVAVSLFAD